MSEFWYCDECYEQVPIERNMVMVPTGEFDEQFNAPVMRFLCISCDSKRR